ncbi:MAG: hypothetical protein ABUL60_09895 [Myxococcales bacterium]
MRLPVFAVLAFIASGCTIHVVEQPATPVLVAAEPPTLVQHRRPARPMTYEPVAAAPRPHPPRPAHPPVAEPARPTLLPFKTLAPEPRHTRLAAMAPPARRRPEKVKRPDPPTRVTLANVAKAQ